MELYDGVKISIGPPIEDGFYYDFEFPEGVAISEADFPQIEERMRAHIKAAEAFEREDVPVERARERFLAERQDYKVELIDDLVRGLNGGGAGRRQGDLTASVHTVSLYTNGPFTDLCRGPHAPSTKTVGAFKLSSVAGAYWRGDSTRTMLTRIYGTAFFSKAELEEHLERIEQAKARDHRKLGRELGLFTFSEVSPGAAFWLPAGTSVFNALVALSRRMGRERGYTRGQDAADLRRRAVEDLGPLGQVPRAHVHARGRGARDGRQADELPGPRPPVRAQPPLLPRPAGPLLRAGPAAPQRGLAACCTGCCACATSPRTTRTSSAPRSRSQDEVSGAPGDGLRRPTSCSTSTSASSSRRARSSASAATRCGTAPRRSSRARSRSSASSYELNPGDGAFYGPKIDMHMTDSLGRSWQLGTVQLDYSMPERFEPRPTPAPTTRSTAR